MDIKNPFSCSFCGSTSFAEGELGNGYANVRPLDKLFSTGSPVLLIFCQKCGEVAFITVENTNKFK